MPFWLRGYSRGLNKHRVRQFLIDMVFLFHCPVWREIEVDYYNTTTGSERFGQVKALKGDLLVVESNQSAGVTWEVEEKLCFPD